MNYISQLNGFRRWRGEHALPASAQLMWYTLTVEQNIRLWPEEFSVSVTDLRRMMGGVSVNTLRRARNVLIEAGLLEADMAAVGGEISRFRLTRLYEEKADPSPDGSPDGSADGSNDGSTDGSTDPSKSAKTPENQAPEPPLKPKTPNVINVKNNSGVPREGEQNGRSVGSRLAGNVGPVPGIRAGGAAGAGRSRSRPGATDWRREQQQGL